MLKDLMRFSVDSSIEQYIIQNELKLFIANRIDVNILPLTINPAIADMIQSIGFSRTSAIQFLDSSSENALL
ncbi:MAG: hypothetical protein WBM98_04600 [Maribacter sp.]|uniref:hypothetical protein n=1 Tax=Maribacter sp. TaxID=1897614 RepID=UPI003C72C9FC